MGLSRLACLLNVASAAAFSLLGGRNSKIAMAATGSTQNRVNGLVGTRHSRCLGPPQCCSPGSFKGALLFDCDGVLVETEELHRTAYNKAFEEFGLHIDGEPVVWTVSYYDKLQNTVGGGKPKMFYHFTQTAGVWPEVTGRGGRPVATNDDEGMALIDELQDCKTEFYKELVTQASPRPGVLALLDEAMATPCLAVGICSASTRGGFEKVVDAVVGKTRLDALDVVIAGDDVKAKKPDPMIYNLAAERLQLENTQCIVVEDSLVGLRAAKSAGMRCVITYTSSTEAEDFYGEGADAKLLDMSSGITVSQLFSADNAPLAEILEDIRDPK